MRGRLSSLTRCIRNAMATWCEFCPEIRRKTKTINRLLLRFFYSQIRMKTKKNKVLTLVGAIVSRLIEMKTKTKRFYLTILLLVVLLRQICFIVRYLTASFEYRPNKLEKRYSPLTLHEGDAEFNRYRYNVSDYDRKQNVKTFF